MRDYVKTGGMLAKKHRIAQLFKVSLFCFVVFLRFSFLGGFILYKLAFQAGVQGFQSVKAPWLHLKKEVLEVFRGHEWVSFYIYSFFNLL